MKLADRIAAWFGYVPAERLAEVVNGYPRTPRTVEFDAIPWLDEQQRQILVAADYNRGHLCS